MRSCLPTATGFSIRSKAQPSAVLAGCTLVRIVVTSLAVSSTVVWSGCDGGNSADACAATSDGAAPSGPTQLASLSANVVWIGVTGGRAYFSEDEDGIYSVPTSGNAEPATVAPATTTGAYLGAYVSNGFAFDSAYVYWSESVGNALSAIKRAPLGGGSSQTLASPHGFISGIAVDAGSVFWVNQDQGNIALVPTAGGATAIIASGLSVPAGIATHAGAVYVTDTGGDMLSVAESGGAITTLVHGPGVPPNTMPTDFSPGIAVDDSRVYFSQPYAQPPRMLAVPLGGGTPTVLATDYAYAIALDAGNAYWISDEDGSLKTTPLAGGAIRVLAANVVNAVGGPTTDGCNLYWATSQGTAGTNALWKIAK